MEDVGPAPWSQVPVTPRPRSQFDGKARGTRSLHLEGTANLGHRPGAARAVAARRPEVVRRFQRRRPERLVPARFEPRQQRRGAARLESADRRRVEPPVAVVLVEPREPRLGPLDLRSRRRVSDDAARRRRGGSKL